MASKRYAMAMGSELERGNAMSAVNWAWRALVALPVAAFFLAAGTWAIGVGETGEPGGWGLIFLLAALLCLALVVPPVFVLRSHCFRAAWRGRPVDPPSYVRGLMTVWVVLEMVVLLSLASCLAYGDLLPGVLPGVLAWTLLAFCGPSERALGLKPDAAA